MRFAFDFSPTEIGTEFRLMSEAGPVPEERWLLVAPPALLPGVEKLKQLVSSDEAIADDAFVLVGDDAVAALSAQDVSSLGLPAMADAMARVETRGLLTHAGFRATVQWCRPNGQAIVGATRVGAWLRYAGGYHRLSPVLLAIAQSVDAISSATDESKRLIAIGRLKDSLPAAQRDGRATALGLPAQINVLQADAFSLDLQGSGTDTRLIPTLHRAGDAAPVLPPEMQEAFGRTLFNSFTDARPVYPLPGDTFVVLAPTLRRALSVVRRHQSSPLSVKRAFLASPRAYLEAELESESDPTLVEQFETVFIETPSYSDRVIGLGLWEPRDLPWLKRLPTNWLDHDATSREAPAGSIAELSAEQAAGLRDRVAAAIDAGEKSIIYRDPNAPADAPPLLVEASREILADLSRRATAADPNDPTPRSKTLSQTEVPLILPNEGQVEHEQDFLARPDLPTGLPHCLETPLKAHQADGVAWLQESWRAGAPGVLLADDMGLGKTLQGLAFLAWLREGMAAGRIPRKPILIVAPTGLLANWSIEHGRHLRGSGLGGCLAAFGPRLRATRSPETGRLDVTKLQTADWVLTTYETLRDYSLDFGLIHFAALLADEAQKVKTPGVRMTDALKAMNADFRVAMTGTPVENRLADLWCIVDGVRSGWLGDLQSFSRAYEADVDLDRVKALKARLDQRFGGTPPLLLRRMKEDHLPDLPLAKVHVERAEMPDRQRQAYEEAVFSARRGGKRGAMLEALQSFRSLSLHPDPGSDVSDGEFIASSARLRLCFEALDRIEQKGERVLIFLGSLALQSKIAGLIQRRYGMQAAPEIINGSVPGGKRQARVDRFQGGPDEFDALLLSPRAAGVGLTITRANHVIHLDRWWNPAVEDQCTGRALRIGQTRTVHVHIPLATLPSASKSFDENLHALLERKRSLMREALLPAEPDASDAEELFRSTVSA